MKPRIYRYIAVRPTGHVQDIYAITADHEGLAISRLVEHINTLDPYCRIVFQEVESHTAPLPEGLKW